MTIITDWTYCAFEIILSHVGNVQFTEIHWISEGFSNPSCDIHTQWTLSTTSASSKLIHHCQLCNASNSLMSVLMRHFKSFVTIL